MNDYFLSLIRLWPSTHSSLPKFQLIYACSYSLSFTYLIEPLFPFLQSFKHCLGSVFVPCVRISSLLTFFSNLGARGWMGKMNRTFRPHNTQQLLAARSYSYVFLYCSIIAFRYPFVVISRWLRLPLVLLLWYLNTFQQPPVRRRAESISVQSSLSSFLFDIPSLMQLLFPSLLWSSQCLSFIRILSP